VVEVKRRPRKLAYRIGMNEKKRKAAIGITALGLLTMVSGFTGGGHLIPPEVRIWTGVIATGAGVIYYWQARKG
jgi:hypothetical protein